jgi:NAD(P)-dependent dehydrogenase (short-subunit alcohol dehydrogenase family)
MTDTQDLSGRFALITGASRGIGYAAAKALAAQGAHIIALARTTGGLEELDDEIKAAGGTATLIPVDITDDAALDGLAPALLERFGKLDIFVANAGVLGELCPAPDIDRKTWDKVLAVNLTSNWKLTSVLDPLLRQSDAPRVVYVSTGTTTTFKPFWGAYTASKAALEAFAYTYANETQNTAVRANILNPGATRTGMRAQAMPGEDPQTLPHPDDVAKLVTEMCSPSFTETGTRINYREWAGIA